MVAQPVYGTKLEPEIEIREPAFACRIQVQRLRRAQRQTHFTLATSATPPSDIIFTSRSASHSGFSSLSFGKKKEKQEK